MISGTRRDPSLGVLREAPGEEFAPVIFESMNRESI